ncbi:MAG: MFS transporter [Dehalococcoidales bacterium]|nr:MFS transporter [Dehalococcoidales bacterium]
MESGPKSSYRFVIEAVMIGILLCNGLIWIAPGPLFPYIMQDFGVDRATVGWTNSLVSLIVAATAIPAGILAGKIGIKRTFAIGAFFVAGGILTPFCSNMVQFLATRVIFALGIAMTFPVSGGLVMQWFQGRELPLVNGINMSAASVGNTIALFGTVLIADALDWKLTLALYSAVAFVFAVAWLIWGKERQSPLATLKTEEAQRRIGIWAALRQKTTLLLALAMGGPNIIFMAISSWLPTYYHEVFGMSLSQASSITALFTLFGIPACVLGGLLPMRIGLRKPFLVIPGLLLGLAALGAFMVNNLVVIYASIILFGICVWIFRPAMFTIPMELHRTSPQIAAAIIGATVALGNVAGFTGPLIVGFLADFSTSYLPGLIACSVLSWSLLVGGLLLPETGPRARRPALPESPAG